MAHSAPITKFGNTSGPNLENNYGNKGKFTQEQSKERMKVHALAIATGFPTYAQIVEQWKQRFAIDITMQSEKEWRKSNRNSIEKKKQELIEKGEIEIPVVSDRVLADSLNVLLIDNCRLAKQIREKASKVLKGIETSTFEGETTMKKTKEQVLVFEALMGAYDKTNNAIVKSFEKMSDLAGRVKMIDAKNDADDAFQQKLEDEEDAEEGVFNPADVEISEEDRKSLQ